MQTLKVRLGIEQQNAVPNRHYDVLVGSGLLEQGGSILARYGWVKTKAVIITDSNVKPLYSSVLQQSLWSSGYEVAILDFPAGEAAKSLESAARLYTELTDIKAERNTVILALGGGVVGDLAGFVAATYLRGVPLVQIPTTILAQCDSSIGGKVAVNHGQLKNKIGTFYQPRLTISDINTLATLSAREISDGLAEVIKYGIILDSDFFDYLEKYTGKIRALDADIVETMVAKSVELKTTIVEQDVFDVGTRNILNYGHTIGHAVESASEMTVWHGEAVAMGMIAEARLANKLGMLSKTEVGRITSLISAAGLPTEINIKISDMFYDLIQRDKKVNQGKIKFALPQGIGKVTMVNDVQIEQIKQVLADKR